MREAMTIVKALADENRLRALLALRNRELCVCQIIELLGLAPSTVSQHMSILRQARLVEGRKDGKWMYYRLAGKGASPAVRSAIEWVRASLSGDSLIEKDAKRVENICRQESEDCKK